MTRGPVSASSTPPANAPALRARTQPRIPRTTSSDLASRRPLTSARVPRAAVATPTSSKTPAGDDLGVARPRSRLGDRGPGHAMPSAARSASLGHGGQAALPLIGGPVPPLRPDVPTGAETGLHGPRSVAIELV